MVSQRLLLNVLADAFVAGEITVETIVGRASRVLGRDWRWIPPLARRFVAATHGRVLPTHRGVVRFLREDLGFCRAWHKHRREISIQHWVLEPQQMRPVAVAEKWNVPPIISVGELAEWLKVTIGELQWFADIKNFRYREEPAPAWHYHYKFLPKRSGGVRLIEIPK